MRIVALLAVVAIVYLFYGRTGEEQSPQARVAAAQQEAALVQPATAPASAQPTTISGSLRATVDTTHRTLDLVRKRNEE